MSPVSSKLILIALAAALQGTPAIGDVLGTYTFPGPDAAGDTNTPIATNLTFTPFTRVNVSAVSAPDAFESASWTLSGAQDLGEYVQFTVTPATNSIMSLATLSFDVQRSVNKRTAGEKDGPLFGEVRIFTGVTLTLAASQSFNPVGVSQNVQVDLNNLTVTGGEPVTVRFYGWGSGHQSGWLNLDNVALQGTVTLVPEPSPTMLMSCGLLLFLAQSSLRRR